MGFVARRTVFCNVTWVRITRKGRTVGFFSGLSVFPWSTRAESGEVNVIYEGFSRKWGWAFFITASSFTWDSFDNLCSIFSLTKWEWHILSGFVTKMFYGLWLKVHANRIFNIFKTIARGLFSSELIAVPSGMATFCVIFRAGFLILYSISKYLVCVLCLQINESAFTNVFISQSPNCIYLAVNSRFPTRVFLSAAWANS